MNILLAPVEIAGVHFPILSLILIATAIVLTVVDLLAAVGWQPLPMPAVFTASSILLAKSNGQRVVNFRAVIERTTFVLLILAVVVVLLL